MEKEPSWCAYGTRRYKIIRETWEYLDRSKTMLKQASDALDVAAEEL
jgi:hypothetical protein